MPERKRKSGVENSCMPGVKNDLLKNESIELGDGCSILMDYDEEAPTMYVKTYGEVDVASLRRKLEQNIPEARIEGLNLNAPTNVRIKKKRIFPSKRADK